MIHLPGRMPLSCDDDTVQANPDGSLNVVIHERAAGQPAPLFSVVITDPAGKELFRDGLSHVFDTVNECGRVESRFVLDAEYEALPTGTVQMHVLMNQTHRTSKWIRVERSPWARRRLGEDCLQKYVLRSELPMDIGCREVPVRYPVALVAPPKVIALGSYNKLDVTAAKPNLTLGISDRYGFNVLVEPVVSVPGHYLTWAVWW